MVNGPTTNRSQDVTPGDGSAAREATVESLLLAGLDAYFAGDLDGAIHTWTRVLFVDRGHARARAYIERARAVLAERQRRGDELVHGGLEAFETGDAERAKELLSSAVAHGAPDALALAVLQRLDRLEARSGPSTAEVDSPASVRESGPVQPPRRSSRVGRWLALCTVILLVAAGALVVEWDRLDAWLVPPPARGGLSIRANPGPLSVPRSSDLSLRRARALQARGHLAEALGVLEGVSTTDPQRAQADRLRMEIEQQLIATLDATPPANRPPTEAARRP